jgi:hypothetical protein
MLVIVASYAAAAAGFIGMAVALRIIWRTSDDFTAAKTAEKAEKSLPWSGILSGAGVALILYSRIGLDMKAIESALKLAGVAGLSAIFAGFKKYHLEAGFTRRSGRGMAREVIVYLIVVLLTAALVLPFAHYFINRSPIGD